ncbi:PREDICTED: interleukin-23 receptor [Chinchilla lanigera]|uniref:interleukin-23 receptor n=1 Tax=Chinchilla lanigera TaxID=34839 RepID=UPI00069744C9|nr:PREDICTED: interleukin-23 receptor [Chinchilla lanigera]
MAAGPGVLFGVRSLFIIAFASLASEKKGFFLPSGMNQVAIQLEVLITLYVLFSWCHGGITNINCSGSIWVEPPTIFKMGTNISVYCQAAGKNCQPRSLYLCKNGVTERFRMSRINRTTARHWLRNFREPHASVFCTAACLGRLQETLVCGQDIFSGYPPDAPREVTCAIREYSGRMTCSWAAGRPTHVDTEFAVRVKSLETGEERRYLASSSANISTQALPAGGEYWVWVQAANALGTEESKPSRVRLDDIVIPSASVISRVETLNATAPKTVVHWESDTALQRLSCEVRHAAAANRTWTVTEFDTNLTYPQQSEFFLEPDVNYTFQVRCREAGKRYWQPWSAPFHHKTPDAVPQVALKSPQHGAEDSDSGPPVASVLKGHLASDRRQDVGLLSGMVFFAVTLSILSLIGIFNRSLRSGIKRKILLLIPAWLHEEIPHMENSSVVKMLQEKHEFVNNNSSEQVLYVDPTITEITEVLPPEERKPASYREEMNTGAQDAKASAFAPSTVVYIPDLTSGYKPQISSFLSAGNHVSSSNETGPPTPKPTVDSFDLGRSARVRRYPQFTLPVSSVNSLSNTLILEELSLILDQGECGPPDTRNSAEGESSLLLENDSASDAIPEQTVLPDEFVSCLGIVDEELPSLNPYFPQNILESHFNRISLLEKQSL